MRGIEDLGLFYLGRVYDPARGAGAGEPFLIEARDLTTHAVCVGMTGSGKTGLGIALLEEAALDGIPAIAIDPKGDLGNLALAFPELRPEDFEPWIDPDEARRAGLAPAEQARVTAERWRAGLAEWGEDAARVARFARAADVVDLHPRQLRRPPDLAAALFRGAASRTGRGPRRAARTRPGRRIGAAGAPRSRRGPAPEPRAHPPRAPRSARPGSAARTSICPD